jgi:acyl carrier protein
MALASYIAPTTGEAGWAPWWRPILAWLPCPIHITAGFASDLFGVNSGHHCVIRDTIAMPNRFNQVIFTHVTDAIEAMFFLKTPVLLPSTRLVDDLAMSRLSRWKLIVALEELFDCEFPNEIVLRFTTLGDIVSYIIHHINPLTTIGRRLGTRRPPSSSASSGINQITLAP